MLKIMFDLTAELNEEAILVSNGDTEVCFFRENKPILLNKPTGMLPRWIYKELEKYKQCPDGDCTKKCEFEVLSAEIEVHNDI